MMDQFDREISDRLQQEAKPLPLEYTEKIDRVLEGLSEKTEIRRKPVSYWKYAAALLLFAVLTTTGTQAAVNLYSKHMTEMNEGEKKDINRKTQSAKTDEDSFSRELTGEEQERLEKLRNKYETEGVFPQEKLLEVEKIKDVSDQRPVYCYENSTFYLPEEMLTRQQMLQIVDFWERRDYAVSMENKQAEEKSKDQNISQEKAIEIAKEYAEKLYGVDCADAVSTIEYDKTQLSVDADASSYYVTLEKETWKYSITVEVDSENGSVNQIDLENKKEEECAAGVVPDEKFYRKNVKKVLQYFDKLNLKKDISSIRMIYKLKEDGTLNRGNVKYMVRLRNGSAGVVMYSVSTKDLYRFYRISDYKVAMQMEDQACEKQRDRGLVIYNKLIMK
ncbi:hypothetical protein [Jutongia huaianensis]|uniref:Uncharacterized protein n=1 Tax=Jutongia huaianensis TaxID=2763668 RepID=A0ABR7N3U0_9FIRM|nr:hypothetical protein [Jutongia huaianensis]MBC8563278.1 hypothetical protein [Jutongia huaianensis]